MARIEQKAFNDPEAERLSRRYYEELSLRLGVDFLSDESSHPTAEEFTGNAGVFVIAYDADQARGCGGLRHLDQQSAEIKHIWVDPTARGLGVGNAILAALEDLATQRGYVRVVLDTSDTLDEARRLYERRGYLEIDAYNNNPFAQLWFALDLDKANG